MLEELIDFLASNIVLIIAVVGGIIAFISDKKKKEEQENEDSKQPVQQQRRQMNGRPIANPEMRRMEKSEQRQHQHTSKPEEIGNKAEPVVEKAVDETKRLLEQAKNARKSTSGAQSRRTQQLNRQRKENHGLSLNNRNRLHRKNLEEAIIMSEILGPPRAFKPHSRNGISTYRK